MDRWLDIGGRLIPMWPFHRMPNDELHTSHLEFAESQARDRRNATGRTLRWETILILADLGALVAVSLGSVAWRAIS